MGTLHPLNIDVSYQISSTVGIWRKSPNSRLIAPTFSKLPAFKVVDDLKSSSSCLSSVQRFCTGCKLSYSLNWEALPPRDQLALIVQLIDLFIYSPLLCLRSIAIIITMISLPEFSSNTKSNSPVPDLSFIYPLL